MTDDKSDFEKRLEEESKQVDEILGGVAKLNQAVPKFQTRKYEIETTLAVLRKLPDEIKVEFIPALEVSYDQNYQYLPGLINKEGLNIIGTMSTSSGTMTTLSGLMNAVPKAYPVDVNDSPWLEDANKIYFGYADRLSRDKQNIERLKRISEDLAKLYVKVSDKYGKAISGNYDVADVADTVRSMINMFWGELKALAKSKNPRIQKSAKRNNEKARQQVAEVLTTRKPEKLKFLLDRLNEIHNYLSENISKDKIKNDFGEFQIQYSDYIAIVHEILDYIFADEYEDWNISF